MQEKRDKIKLGLVEPAAPKVKVANMVSVLGTDALINPSRAEQVCLYVCLSVCLSSIRSFDIRPRFPFSVTHTITTQVVRTQVALRQEKHESDNKARQLTKQQRREKIQTKLQKGTDVQINVAVFRCVGDVMR